MTIQTAQVNLKCDRCGEQISKGSRFALVQGVQKDLFGIPAENTAKKYLCMCLSHVYSEAQERLNTRFVQLDLFAGVK